MIAMIFYHKWVKSINEGFLWIRLKDFAKLYDVIKNERNKCVNLIQTSTQKAAEMKEKIKILQNEIEILRTEVSKKDKSVVSHVGINVFLLAAKK